MLNNSEKYDIFILRLHKASKFAFPIEIALRSDQKRMRKWILKGTTLKTPFHIASYRMKLNSHCTFSGSYFCYDRDKGQFILGNI